MKRLPLLSFVTLALLIFLFPVIVGAVVNDSLLKLHLTEQQALLIVFGVLIGSMINIPFLRIERNEDVPVDPFAIFGFSGFMQRWQRATIIAANVGGCLGLRRAWRFTSSQAQPEGRKGAGIASAITTIVCFFIARPVPGIGILIPGLIPPAVAASSAILVGGTEAAPIAFIAGVAGVLIGADFFHLPTVARTHTGLASIGGAGSFDGIVLSGVIAAYLA
ncbi:MAG: DUF1614 domain-containing protein [Alphaproteobacteria bacterium]